MLDVTMKEGPDGVEPITLTVTLKLEPSGPEALSSMPQVIHRFKNRLIKFCEHEISSRMVDLSVPLSESSARILACELRNAHIRTSNGEEPYWFREYQVETSPEVMDWLATETHKFLDATDTQVIERFVDQWRADVALDLEGIDRIDCIRRMTFCIDRKSLKV